MGDKKPDNKTKGTVKQEIDIKAHRRRKLQAIRSFAGGIANDFNEILAVIMGYIELTRLDMPVDSASRNNLDSAMNAIDRAKDLVVDILSYNRQHELERTPIQIRPIVEKCLTSFRSSLPDKIKIQESIECEDCRVSANPSQIRQIVTNLCTNAGQAMLDKGGVIDITLENKTVDGQETVFPGDPLPGKYIALTVHDTGRGMDEETIEKIFDPYFTTLEAGPGSGMGLAMVDSIVELCSGYMDVESVSGRGTTFTILLPEV
jgi:signal transduction histidine kinase